MKRGKDDDKIMGPMFPRLHVNDTEKGGPRAPPRNKMALYEQLSVPSQRFNPGVLPRNPTNNSSLVRPSSSSQGSGHERNMFLPLHLHHSTHQTEHTHASYSVLNHSMPQLEQKKKLDEEDFQVPIFVQSSIGHNHSETNNSMDWERDLPLARPSSGHLMKLQNAGERGQKRTCMASLNSRQEDRAQSEASSKEIVAARERSVKSASHPSVRERSDDLSMRANIYSTHEHRDHAETNFCRLQKTDVSLQQLRAGSRLENTSHSNDVEEQRSLDDPTNEYENCEDNRPGLLQTGNMEKADDVSETSMLDSVSELDISPDDVVGIIGQKHFWKARRAIVNQQRAFAIQVFELHRLIKVQRLIAGSPNLLFEDHAYLGSRSLKDIHSNKLPLDYIVETPPSIVKNKDDLEKPDTENAVGKISLSSVQNGSATSNYRPFSGNLQGTTKMNPPHFPQPSGHQWLVPMISPSEGLVYKPYSGPGPWGGHGSLESTPLMRDLTQAYGVPTSPYHYQGIGFPFFFHGCLPPYGMTVMNPAISGSVEQINRAGPSQLSGGEANFFTQHHHSSSNMPGWRDGIVSNVVKGNELQGSTASSPSKRQGNGAGHAGEGKNLLPLLSTPVIEKVSQSQDMDQPAQVIKVVPHNARSATESAARIFQSIQKERGHY